MIKKCPNCGNAIKNKEICPFCGAHVGLSVSMDNSRPKIKKTIPIPNKASSKSAKKNKPLKEHNDPQNYRRTESKSLGSIVSSVVGILCIIGVMLIVVSGIMAPDEDNNVINNQTNKITSNNTINSSQLTIQVNVIYNNQWSGSIGLNEDLDTYNRNSSKTIEFTDCKKDDTISASVQKKDSSNDELKVQVFKNGEIVKEESTKTPYGIVTISI